MKKKVKLKPVDQERLDEFKAEIDLLNIRFPIAELSRRMDTNKGNLSAYINGKKPISGQFLNRFHEVFKNDLEDAIRKRDQETMPQEEEETIVQPTGNFNNYTHSLDEDYPALPNSDVALRMLDLEFVIRKLDRKLSFLIKRIFGEQ